MQAFEPNYSAPHNSGMEVPELLRSIAAAAKVKQTGLGGIIGVTQPQISRYMKGAQPKKPAYEKILAAARRYGLADAEIRSEDVAAAIEPEAEPTVPLRGYVAAGSRAHFLPLEGGEFDRVRAPPGTNEKTFALEIRGDSLGELFDRWLVYADDVRSPVTPDLIGKPCVVGLADGRVMVKKLKRSKGGLYDLLSNTEDPILAVAVDWAAKVKHMGPR